MIRDYINLLKILQKMFVQLYIQKFEIIILMIKLWPDLDQLDM